MTHSRLPAIAVCAALTGACPIAPGTLESATTTTSTDQDTGLTSTTSTTSTGGSTSTPTDSGATFIIARDGGVGEDCDPFAQNCRPGEKCTWWASDGGNSWNATRCVQIDRDPAQLNEPCVVEGSGASGNDDCDLGLMCWDLDASTHGTCTALCLGDGRAPTCPPDSRCTFYSQDFALCIGPCDPLAQDCAGGDLCLPVNNTYVCVLDASGDEGQLHDPCDYANACDEGLVCLPSASSPKCDQGATSCCLPMCDINEPNCPDAGQSCLPMYEPQPADFEHVGYCSVMP